MTDKKISVIISTYNSEDFMRECLKEVVKQTVFDLLEVLIVDANSQQNEFRIVREFQKKYNNIFYKRLDARVGIYSAWNIAIKKTSARYILPFSTNDRLNPKCCEILKNALDSNKEIDLVYGDTYISKKHCTPFEHGDMEEGKVMQWGPYSYKYLLTHNCIGPHPMWRRNIHKKIGYFDESYTALGDQEFWLRLGKVSKMMHIPLFTGMYWSSETSLSGNDVRKKEFQRARSPYIAELESDLEKIHKSMVAVQNLMENKQEQRALKMLESIKKRYEYLITG